MTTLDATAGEGLRAALGRLPVIGPAGRRLRARWELAQPFPLPRYVAGTPRIGGTGPLDPFFPPTAPTLGEAAMSEEAVRFVSEVAGRLTQGGTLAKQRFFFEWGQAKFGRNWRFANILTVLWAAATFVQPKAYLEIGVHRGRSAAIVGALCPDCAIYGFDLWIPGYAGDDNPGPDFVRDELRAAGHRGELTLVSGDSGETLPAFLRDHPDLYFDVVTVDGGKTVVGAASDFANALPRLKVGGILVYDDLAVFPRLERVWHRVARRDDRYATWEFPDARFGAAAAIRVGDRGRFT